MDITVPKTKYEVTVESKTTYEIELPSTEYVDENGNPILDIDEAISIDKELDLADIQEGGNTTMKWSYKKV